MDIVLAFNDKYVQHAAVLMSSLLRNTSTRSTFHCLSSDVSKKNMSRLKSLAAKFSSKVEFHKVDLSLFENFYLGNLTVETYFRLLIPEIFENKDKVLYLDVDMVVLGDICELYNIELDANCDLAAVADPGVDKFFIEKISYDKTKYFNAGVALFNFTKIHKSSSDLWMSFARNKVYAITYHDQCVLNHHLNFFKLHPRFNLMAQFFRRYEDLGNHEYSNEEIQEALISPLIVHFNASFGKPWQFRCSHPLKDLYIKYLLLSPFWFRAPKLILWGLLFSSARFCKKMGSQIKRILKVFRFH